MKKTEMSKTHIVQIIEEWKDSHLKLNNMILKDAFKEFDSNSRIGFGIDGSLAEKETDFTEVRGTYDDNSFVKGLRSQSQTIEETAKKWLSLLS